MNINKKFDMVSIEFRIKSIKLVLDTIRSTEEPELVRTSQVMNCMDLMLSDLCELVLINGTLSDDEKIGESAIKAAKILKEASSELAGLNEDIFDRYAFSNEKDTYPDGAANVIIRESLSSICEKLEAAAKAVSGNLTES